MRRIKIKVKREWGKDVGSDVRKFNILAIGGFHKMARCVGKRVLKKKWLPKPTIYENLTTDYQKWFAKKHRRKK